MRMCKSRFHKLRIPVCISLVIGWIERLEACCSVKCHIVKLAVLLSVCKLHDVCRHLYTGIAVICHSHVSCLTLLCCDDDDTISCTHTIDGCCRSILKDCEGLDIAAGEEVDVIHEGTINNIKRICIVSDRADTTDLHRRTGTWSTALSDLDTAYHT